MHAKVLIISILIGRQLEMVNVILKLGFLSFYEMQQAFGFTFNPVVPNVLFLYPLKASENQKFRNASMVSNEK